MVCGSGGRGIAGTPVGAAAPAGATGRGAVVGWYKVPLTLPLLLTEHSVEGRLIDDFDTELTRLVELCARSRSRNEQIRFRAHRPRYLRAERFRERLCFFARPTRERSREH